MKNSTIVEKTILKIFGKTDEYEINLKEKKCSCLAFKYSKDGYCKHLECSLGRDDITSSYYLILHGKSYLLKECNNKYDLPDKIRHFLFWLCNYVNILDEYTLKTIYKFNAALLKDVKLKIVINWQKDLLYLCKKIANKYGIINVLNQKKVYSECFKKMICTEFGSNGKLHKILEKIFPLDDQKYV